MRQITYGRYGAVARLLHWLTAILVLVAFLYGPGGSEQRVYSAAADGDRQIHETLGLTVFVLVVLRVVWRMMDTRPEPPAMARWMGFASRAVQAGLYVLMFAVPLSAIVGAWLGGHPLTLLAGVQIAPLIPPSDTWGDRIAELHTWLGDAILWLAGFHAAAALLHHFVLKDTVLLSMLPDWRKGRPRL